MRGTDGDGEVGRLAANALVKGRVTVLGTHRATQAMRESVSSPLRLAFSVGTGLVLIAAGVAWGLWPNLPLGGWATGASLILSGLILLGLLVVSHRQVAQQRRTLAS